MSSTRERQERDASLKRPDEFVPNSNPTASGMGGVFGGINRVRDSQLVASGMREIKPTFVDSWDEGAKREQQRIENIRRQREIERETAKLRAENDKKFIAERNLKTLQTALANAKRLEIVAMINAYGLKAAEVDEIVAKLKREGVNDEPWAWQAALNERENTCHCERRKVIKIF